MRELTKIELFNASSANTLKDAVGKELTVVAAGNKESMDIETGEKKNVCVIVDDTGEIYAGTSVTVANDVADLVDMFPDNNVKISIEEKKGKKGNYCKIKLLEVL